MPVLFDDLPTDLILEVVNFLELPDPLSLLLTCSSIYALSDHRSFWISILETTRRKSPIACSPHADLSRYNLGTLKGLVVSWIKLHENWNQLFPETVHPVTSTRLSAPAEIIFNVQGTDILILNSRGSVFCWDAKLAAPFPFPAIETGGRIAGVSAPSEIRGVCSFAFLTAQFVIPIAAHRYVLTIKHEEGKVTGFTHEFSKVSVPDGAHFESLFLTEDVVGSIVALETKEDCIVSVSAAHSHPRLPDSAGPLNLHRPVSSRNELIVCFAYKGHLYNLLEDGLSVQIQHISQRSLRSGHCDERALYNSELRVPHNDLTPFCFMLPSTPLYGVSAVFVRLSWDPADTSRSKSFSSFTFLLSTLTNAPDDEVSSPLAFDSQCVTGYVPGALLNMSLMWMDHSGFNVAMVVQSPLRLVLLRYHPETRTTSVHTLAVPDTIELNNLSSVCIDDTAGAVHAVDRLGLISTLRYI